MRRAYSYKRFSSPKQADGDSLRRQTAFEREMIAEMNLQLDDSLDLTDRGVSGFHGDNSKFGALSQFLEVVKAGRVPAGSVLLVENLDRLSRENVLDAFDLFSGIIRAGITIVTGIPREVYDRKSVSTDLAKLMIPLMCMVRAHDESATKSARLRAAWNRRRERALGDGVPLTGRCPAWLEVTEKGYQVIPSRAKTIRRLYALVQDGLGLKRVTRALVDEGHAPFGPSARWNESYVRKLLTWPAVCGEMQPHIYVNGAKTPHGEPVPDYYPQVIDREQFQLVQATMTERHAKAGRPARGEGNIFTGIVYHVADSRATGKKCRMVLVTSGSMGGRRYTYLTSYEFKRGGFVGADGRSISYPQFERSVLNAVEELEPKHVQDQSQAGTAERDEQIQKLSGHLVVLDNRYREAEADFLDPENRTPAAELNDRLNKLSEAKRQTADKLAQLQADAMNCRAESLGEVKSLVRLMAEAKGAERINLRRKVKARFRWLVKEVWVHVETRNKYTKLAHVQLFLRNGLRRYFWFLSAHSATDPAREVIPPRRTFEDVDFRTFDPRDPTGTGKTKSGAQPKPVKRRTDSQTSRHRE